MSYALVLNSSNVVGSNNNTFQFNFINGSFNVKDAELAISSIQIPYSWYNVSTNYNNNKFSLVFPVGSSTSTLSIVLPNGYYTVVDIQNYIQQQCIANNYYLVNTSGNYVYYFDMVYSINYYAIQLIMVNVPTTLPTGWTLPSAGTGGWATSLPTTGYTPQIILPATGSIANIIGFSSGITLPASLTTSSVNYLSTTTPLGSIVNSLVVHCSIVKNPVASPTDILDAIPINISYGNNINYQPTFERWLNISDGTYSNLVITFTDQNMNTLYARDPNTTITLLLRKKNV